MRQGVTSDDQKSLHLAELRLVHASRHALYDQDRLKVGRIQSQYAAAFYNVINASVGKARQDGARITRLLDGRIHILHSTNVSLCDTFNLDAHGRAIPNEARVRARGRGW